MAAAPKTRPRKTLADFPDVAKSYDVAENGERDLTTILAGSSKKFFWRCSLDPKHQWETTVQSRTGGSGCPYCSGYLTMPKDSLAITHPHIAAQWDSDKNGKLTPYDLKAQSNKRVHWRCSVVDDHVWEATPQDRTRSKGGCPCCLGHVVVLSNCLATTRPDLAAQWHPTKNGDTTPYSVTDGSAYCATWRCDVPGHPDWQAPVKNRSRSRLALCPSCAPHGFSPGLPGGLYLIAHEEKGLLQVGISNDLKRRLKEHARGGWRVLDCTSNDIDGDQVVLVERTVLSYLREVAQMASVQVHGKFSGVTEAWVAESLRVGTLEELFALAGAHQLLTAV